MSVDNTSKYNWDFKHKLFWFTRVNITEIRTKWLFIKGNILRKETIHLVENQHLVY